MLYISYTHIFLLSNSGFLSFNSYSLYVGMHDALSKRFMPCFVAIFTFKKAVLQEKVFTEMADTKSSKPRFGILNQFNTSQLSLRNFISRYVVSPHDIDDVTQETFLRAYKAEQEKDKEIEHPKAFLFRIAKNLMLSEFSRKARKITDYIEDYDNTEEILNSENLEANVMAQQKLGIYCEAVASLPKQCRKVVIMKKVYGMQNKEIARRLELSVSTVEKHLCKGIRQLSTAVSTRYGEVHQETDINANRGGVK